MCPRLTKYISTYLLTVVAAHVGCLVVSAAAADLGDQEAEAEQQQEEDALVHANDGGGGVTVRLRVAQLCDAATNLSWTGICYLQHSLVPAACSASADWAGVLKIYLTILQNCGLFTCF